MKENTSIEKEVLKRIRDQVNPNLQIRKHLTVLKFFWIISCLFSVSFTYCLYAYPELRRQLEYSYSLLMYLPTLFVVILVFLGLRLQEIKIIEFKNRSKFKDN